MTLGCQNMLSYLGCLLVRSPSPKAIKYRVRAAHSVTQSCLTLCNPIDCSPPGSSFHGIFQAGIPEWVAISYSRGSSQPRDWTPIPCMSMGFSRQEYWSGLPFPTLWDLPDPGIEPAPLASPALTGGFFTAVPPGKLENLYSYSCYLL